MKFKNKFHKDNSIYHYLLDVYGGGYRGNVFVIMWAKMSANYKRRQSIGLGSW